MKRFKNILAVYDGNIGTEDALDQAIMLAQRNQARLTIVDLIEPDRQSSNVIQERQRRLQRLLTGVKADSIEEGNARVLVGTPFLEIIREVLREQHDLVIASAEGGSVVKNVFFGSTATHLIRKCPCAVWIIKPGQRVPYVRILAAVDPKADDPSSASLNIKIMDLSTSLARMSGAELNIVHAWEVTGKDHDTLASEAPAATHKAILERHEAFHRDAVGSLLQSYSLADINHEILLRRGMPQQVIVELVQDRDVDVIAMGTVTKTGIPGLLMGNTAETIFSAVTCGVLVVKPDGFVTPVTLV
jgi:nucleotide-binding universal stress UspA family protein